MMGTLTCIGETLWVLDFPIVWIVRQVLAEEVVLLVQGRAARRAARGEGVKSGSVHVRCRVNGILRPQKKMGWVMSPWVYRTSSLEVKTLDEAQRGGRVKTWHGVMGNSGCWKSDTFLGTAVGGSGLENRWLLCKPGSGVLGQRVG